MARRDEAALARPRQKWHYQPKVSLLALAAAYGYGLSRGHAYRDGNKRVAFVVMVVFLELNGWVFEAKEASRKRPWRNGSAVIPRGDVSG